MNFKIYQQVEDDKCIEESLFSVFRIEESDDFGLIINSKEFDGTTEKREIDKKDIMFTRVEVFLKKLEVVEK